MLLRCRGSVHDGVALLRGAEVALNVEVTSRLDMFNPSMPCGRLGGSFFFLGGGDWTSGCYEQTCLEQRQGWVTMIQLCRPWQRTLSRYSLSWLSSSRSFDDPPFLCFTPDAVLEIVDAITLYPEHRQA